jgi:hypothetical protein
MSIYAGVTSTAVSKTLLSTVSVDIWPSPMEHTKLTKCPLVRWKSIPLTVCRRTHAWLEVTLTQHAITMTSFGAGGVIVWGCFSLRCKSGLYVLNSNLNGQIYRPWFRTYNIVVPQIDSHPLACRPLYIGDNARPHRYRIMTWKGNGYDFLPSHVSKHETNRERVG